MTTATSSSEAVRPSSHAALRIALWAAQVGLAAMFLFSGWLKVSLSGAELSEMMSIPRVLGEPMTRFIGACELLGAVGLILPALTRIKPWLTPLAAAALGLVMVLGALYHLSQGELGGIPINIVLGAAAAFVAWGRMRAAPIA